MKFPWQKKPLQPERATNPSTPSSPEKSIEPHPPQQPQDGETRVIPVPEDKQSNPRTSLERSEAAEEPVADTDQSRTAEGKEAETDLVFTASRTTQPSSVGEAGEDDESKYPKTLPLVLLTFGLCMSTFVVALDNTIIATAIPRITTVFDSLNDVGWYGSSYLLTTTSLQPSFGKVYTYFNIKWTYIVALIIFEIGSVICAAAVNSTMLIVGRAVAGVGAAALFSGAMTIIGFSVPLRKRAIYIAMLSSMFGISSVVGPILGGAFTDRLSWRWCFWINLPLGGIAIAVVFFFFKNPERKHNKLTTKEKIGEIDLLGAFFLICAIVCLLLALQWGGSVYPWSNSRVWGTLLGGGLITIVFCYLQYKRGDRATIPPRILLKQRTVLACALFYLPFYFQAVKGTTAEGSGIRTIPYLVSTTLASIVVGGSITAIGPYVPFTWAGSVIFVIGSGMLYTLKVNSSTGMWIGYQILAGAGAGACVQIPFIATQVVLNKKDMPSGNAVAIFFNTLGGAIAISIAQNIFSNTLISQIPRFTRNIDPAMIIGAGATNIRAVTPPEELPGVLEAYNVAVTRTFILPIACAGVACLCSLLFEWRSVKGKKLEMGAAA
ncbi:hypothetical protein EPUS_00801 [Endocarpon pusillum Z07020]|uniref:Major facilitator superfamily (MFS) profile domain-containing protein n=1 Tax=Endocarpon pusillum (strain Z07020 / HMAS-L-300199) TaxID=1263415 RepID=U1GRS0_ENDPU|nr:uncharacterized protein EPUS_00801 [Endocarpon pusillum Z07020]ERF74671.1 hypothetical protein EPUS_00801 [Endocarpon pusillum Z07020]